MAAQHDDEDGHDHGQTVTSDNERRIRFVFIFTAGYAVVQAIGGWLSGSLALIADSGHMVSDAAALLLALIAYRVARRPADGTRTYGFHRVRVLAALANGATLLLLVAWITWEAIQRFNQPVEVLAGGRTKAELFWTDLFRQSCKQVHVATDDGSLGLCGACTDALPELLAKGEYDGVLTCGPRPMMQRVAALATMAGVRTQVSLEEHMACGLGACLSCTCGAADGGSRQVCKDGPVFWSEEVDWS